MSPFLVCDLDGDGRDEIVRGSVAVGPDGRVRWTWPRAATDSAVLGRPFPGPAPAEVVLLDAAGRVAGFDARGLLWERDLPQAAGGWLLCGRFAAVGRQAGVIARDGAPTGLLIDGLGSTDFELLRRAAAGGEGSAIAVDPARLVCDWNGDGRDEAWCVDKSAASAAAGWFDLLTGRPVARIAFDGRLVGLADVDRDGRDDLLYFQANSLVIHRR